MKSKRLFIFSMITVQLLFWFYLLSKISYEGYFIGRLLIVLFSLSLTVGFFLYFIALSHMIQNGRTELQVRIMEQEKNIKDKEEKRLEQMISEKNMIKKQTIDQLHNLKAFISKNDSDHIQHHLMSMKSMLKSNRPYYYCNNALLNAIFHEKQYIAESKNITVHYRISFPEQYSISQSELASLFFNLLDNAIEACEHSNHSSPMITLNTFFKDSILSIHMTNSKNINLTFNKKTLKKDNISHGLGLSIIEDIVYSHHGHVSWLDHNDTFESVLLLEIN